MAHVPNEWWEYLRMLCVIMVRHPHCSAAAIVSVSITVWWIITSGSGSHIHTWKKPQSHMFPLTSPVYDIYNGSLECLVKVLNKQQFHFVVFYAPWSAHSRALVPEFFTAAKQMKNQHVIFTAINCWTGSCRANYTFPSFPKLYCYHTRFNPVEYLGPLKSHKMMHFLHNIMRPFTFIPTEYALKSFLKSNEVAVLGYFQWKHIRLKERQYSTFFEVCIGSSNHANKVAFGVVSREDIALLVKLKQHGDIQRHQLFSASLSYPSHFNYTVADIHHWIYSQGKQIVVQLTPKMSELAFYKQQLKKGPALLLFLPFRLKRRKDIFVAYKRTAEEYNNCSCSSVSDRHHWPSRKEIKSMVKIHKRCRSSRQKSPTLDLSTTFEICQECTHFCSTEDHMDAVLRTLRGNKHMKHSCKRSPNCHTFPPRDYYNDDKVHGCFVDMKSECDTEYKQKVKKKVKDLDMTDSETAQSLFALLQGFEKVLSASFVKMDSGAMNDFKEKLKLLTEKDATADNPLANIAKSSKTLIEKPVHKNKTMNCLSSLDSIFVHKLKSNAWRHFPGLKCRTNRTLNFFYLDSDEYFSIAESLGVNNTNLYDKRTTLAIVDMKAEATFIFPEYRKIEDNSLVAFIVNYTVGTLTRHLRSSSTFSKRICFNDKAGAFCVVEVSSNSFKATVLDGTKDVFLLYTASWCGHCKLPNHLLLQLANILRNVKSLVFAKVDADKNDLPYEFSVDGFPTMILFPAERKDFSAKYPEEKPLTLKHLLYFILKFSSHATQSNIRHLLRTVG